MSTAALAPEETTTDRYAGLDIAVTAPPAWSVPAHRAALTAAGRRLVVVDTETTHLQAFPGSVTEIAWYELGTGIGGSFIPPHTLAGASAQALDVSRYYERIAGKAHDDAQVDAFHAMLAAGTRAVIVGSNPNFDRAQLNALFAWRGLPTDPWHRRLIDPAAAAYWLFGDSPIGVPTGLAAAAELCNVDAEGHHDALVDVLITAQVWHACETRRAQLCTD